MIDWQNEGYKMTAVSGTGVDVGFTDQMSPDAMFTKTGISLRNSGDASFSGTIGANSIGAENGYNGGFSTLNGQWVAVRGGIITDVS